MRALVHASARVGLLARIHCARWMCVRDRELEKEREILYVCVCVFHYPAARFLTSLFSGPSEEQSFLSVSQSVFGEMIVGFSERVALFGKEQARIALFPFIIILFLSPPNILLYYLFSFCPFLPYFSSPPLSLSPFHSGLAHPHAKRSLLIPHPHSFCFPLPGLRQRVISKAANVPVGVC